MNQKAKWVISLLPLFLVGFLISQEEKFFSPGTKENYKITYFQPKDLSRDAFLVSVRTLRPDIFLEELKAKPPKWRIQVEGVVGIKRKKNSNEIIERRGIIYADIYESYIQLDKDDPFLVNFEIILYSKIEPGEANVQLFRIEGEEENLVANYRIEIPERYSNPGKQPIVYFITPEAGKRGDTITVTGKNFGNDIDDIVLYFGEFIKTEQGEVYREILERKPFYLSSVNEEGNQELKFHIPSRTDLTEDYLYKRNLTLQVNVNGRPSGLLKLVVLTESWKLWLGLFSILILALLYLCLVFILKKFNFLDMLFIDKTTNTYSLSRFQALIWTVVLIGGYFYIAICNGLLLGTGVIPDFPPSLIGLLSVSYVGLIGANGLGSKKPKNEIIDTPPQLSNLFSSGGSIDMARLQLFAFTVVGTLIYLYNLFKVNPLNGLPEIPTTLLGLMGVSQTGYLSGKVLGDKAIVNMLKPSYIPKGIGNLKIQIIGAGFTKNTKVLLDEFVEPLDTIFISQTSLAFVIPEAGFYDTGKKNLTLMPNDATTIVVENCFEVISIEPNKIPANAGATIEVNISEAEADAEITLYGDSDEVYEPSNITLSDKGFALELPPMLVGFKWLSIYYPSKNKTVDIENAIEVYSVDDSFIDPNAEPPESWDGDDEDNGNENSPNDSGTVAFDSVTEITIEENKSQITKKEIPKRRRSPSSATYQYLEFTINP